MWWPSRHLEISTKAGYRANLEKHFLPYFGDMPMASIRPSTVQAWVSKAVSDGLSPRSVVKYHVMLHGVFKRAVRDRVISHNPCAETELPKVVPAKVQVLAPEDFDRLLQEIPPRFEALVMTAIETGLRWGELIALRPRHVDFLRRLITVEETIVEVSKRHSPTGDRVIVKPYPRPPRAATRRAHVASGQARRRPPVRRRRGSARRRRQPFGSGETPLAVPRARIERASSLRLDSHCPEGGRFPAGFTGNASRAGLG